MKRMQELFGKYFKNLIASFALMYAGEALNRICFYIFHQPKMPEEILSLKKDENGKVS